MSTAPTRTAKSKAAAKTTLPSKAAARPPTVAARPKKGSSGPPPASGPGLNVEERDRLIAQAAYFRAEKRGFAPGYELQDWVEAEAEVLRLIGSA